MTSSYTVKRPRPTVVWEVFSGVLLRGIIRWGLSALQRLYTFAVQLITPPGCEAEGVGDFPEGYALNVPFLWHVTFGIVQQYQRVFNFIENFIGPHCQIEQLMLEEIYIFHGFLDGTGEGSVLGRHGGKRLHQGGGAVSCRFDSAAEHGFLSLAGVIPAQPLNHILIVHGVALLSRQ